MVAVQILIGFLMLLLGRWNYAIFAGGVVFYLASLATAILAPDQDMIYNLLIAAVAGFLAGFGSYVLKRIVAYIAVFLAAGTLIFNLVTAYDWYPALASWQAYVVAGILCVGAALVAFDFTVVIVSTLLGASVIVQYISLPPPFSGFIWYIVLVAFGLVVQFVLMQYSNPAPD